MSENPSPEQAPIRVRPACERDLETVAAILVESFRSKFEVALAERADRALHIVAQTMALEVPRGLPGLYVATVARRVVGTITLRRQSDPDASDWDATGILFAELGLWGGLRAMFYFSLLDQSCGRNEVYVSDVATAPDMRRQGVAGAMLRHAEKMARSWGKTALVLDVTAHNEGAIHLYERLGYTVQRWRRPLLAGWLLKEKEWVRMRKDLT
jgi:ribosomal protein S18 acetylase RimI-like enzyme